MIAPPMLPEALDERAAWIARELETDWTRCGPGFPDFDSLQARDVMAPEGSGASTPASFWHEHDRRGFRIKPSAGGRPVLSWTIPQALSWLQSYRAADPAAAHARDIEQALCLLENGRSLRANAWRILHDPTHPAYMPETPRPSMFSSAYNAIENLGHADRFERQALQRLAELESRDVPGAMALTLF